LAAVAERAEGRQGTVTSAFGVGRREGHDASGFYARFTPPELSDDDVVRRAGVVDEIYAGDARTMDRVQPSSVALVVTSPPYFAGKAYEAELGERHIPATYLDYLQMLEDVFAECVDKLEPGGRLAVNVANLGRKPYRSLSADVTTILQDRLGLLLRGEVIWQKGRGAGGNCAWGSFKQPSNPTLRDLTERVVIASKGRFDRARPAKQRRAEGLPHLATTTADEFMAATLDLWELPTERATRVGHPAPFPVELPQRLIELYTYLGDVVLDPFMGSGSTAVAAVRTGRHYLGYDTDEGYVQAARARVGAEVEALATAGGAPDQQPDGPGAAQPVRQPDKVLDAASAALADAGFSVTDGKRRRFTGGVPVDLIAAVPEGDELLVLVAGGSTVARTGLRRSDVLFRVLGEAAVLSGGGHRVLVLSSDLPAPSSSQAGALRGVVGSVVVDALELGQPATDARLRELAGSRG
jgi:DNA modification methylase